MKLNSKSGATLAAAAATLFLASSVVSTVSTPANAATGKCMLREQAEERSSGAMMFKSGDAVLKRGYVWNEIGIAATMYNL